ncbi:MAG: ATP-binding protein [Bacteroidota bacterium]|nr:ATP-binding protein [Bacteroidota bacterium]
MLLEFTVGNYLSFKDKKTLSLEASSIKEFPENVFQAGKYNLLRSAVIYGANSSGKSNLIKAMQKMSEIILNSSKQSSTDKIDVIPFLLNIETENAPSYFEILFLIDDVRYRYGFEVDKDIVHSEWLFACTGTKEQMLFIREKDEIEISNDFVEGKGLEERVRDNGLFLSVVDQFNGRISKKILTYMNLKLQFISGISHNAGATIYFLSNKTYDAQIRQFLRLFNLGFDEFEVNEKIIEGLNDGTWLRYLNEKIRTIHYKYNDQGVRIGTQPFSLENQESSGTNKLFDLIGSIISSLIYGNTFFVDELDAKLHPLLTLQIVKLFHSPETNPKNAQLIFATHDTNLLDYGQFRRDQIYFTEKDRMEATDLYSLVEFKDADGVKVRNDRKFEKDYIAGRYGAIPFIGDISNIMKDGTDSEN